MKQFFECSEFECGHRTKEYGNMTMKELYSKLDSEGEAKISSSSGGTTFLCPKCLSEMVYVSLGGEPQNKKALFDISKEPDNKEDEAVLSNSFLLLMDIMTEVQQGDLKRKYFMYVKTEKENGRKAVPLYLFGLNFIKEVVHKHKDVE